MGTGAEFGQQPRGRVQGQGVLVDPPPPGILPGHRPLPDTANSYHDGRGHLVLATRAERYGGTDSITRDYTSARISTKDRHAFQYGRFEARMQTPAGRGSGGILGAGHRHRPGGLARCGEIDVMENLGQEPRTASGTIHGPCGRTGTQADYEPGHSVLHTALLSQQFHTYGVQWLPGSIQFPSTVDRTGRSPPRTFRQGRGGCPTTRSISSSTWPVGGRWAGSPGASATFPQALRVDYVRVYQ
jgi:beta-glucanase (GH16 family)